VYNKRYYKGENTNSGIIIIQSIQEHLKRTANNPYLIYFQGYRKIPCGGFFDYEFSGRRHH
jgi:hypothetical protein